MYLYGYAASDRNTVPEIRSGQYENLPEKVEFGKLATDVIIRILYEHHYGTSAGRTNRARSWEYPPFHPSKR